jgi:hypothetical protein
LMALSFGMALAVEEHLEIFQWDKNRQRKERKKWMWLAGRIFLESK